MVVLNKWNDEDSLAAIDEYSSRGISKDLALRTYSSRLIGSDKELVLHGGGNTSVKTFETTISGDEVEVLCVKGSGWDLSTIEPEGHPAVKLKSLLKLKDLSSLSDEDMVASQRLNLLNPNAPNPSVEALLHAFLPEKFIDHTHSIAVLSIADLKNSEEVCKSIYGDKVAIVPYIMPGFDLAIHASKYYEEAKSKALKKGTELEGMILLKHGIFTFGETAKESYCRMINLVSAAENFLKTKINLNLEKRSVELATQKKLFEIMPFLRGLLARKSVKTKERWILHYRDSDLIKKIVNHEDIFEIANYGVATPDHVIRTKEKPLVLESFPDFKKDLLSLELLNQWKINTKDRLNEYIENYQEYFETNNNNVGGTKISLDPLPRFIFIKGLGMITLGKTLKEAELVGDIAESWSATVLAAKSIGIFSSVSEKEIFDMEYWSLEQAKLKKGKEESHNRNIVLITGGAGTIGSSIASRFTSCGAEVIIVDKDVEQLKITSKNIGSKCKAIKCDLTDSKEIENLFLKIISTYGGLDILVLNAGIALQGQMSTLDSEVLRKSFELNFFSQQAIIKKALSIFKKQDLNYSDNTFLLGGQLLFNISKQTLNPGKGFGAYGISKSALLALMKQYAIEEGPNSIRSNGVNADRIRSGLLTEEMITERSHARGLDESEYMKGNLLKKEVEANDVADAFISLSLMKKTTGAIITVDGGNTAAMVR